MALLFNLSILTLVDIRRVKVDHWTNVILLVDFLFEEIVHASVKGELARVGGERQSKASTYQHPICNFRQIFRRTKRYLLETPWLDGKVSDISIGLGFGVSLSVCLSICGYKAECLYLYVCIYVSVSMCLYLCVCIYVSVSMCLWLCVWTCMSVWCCVFNYVSLSACLWLCICVCVSIAL